MNSECNAPASDGVHLCEVALNHPEVTAGQEKVHGQMETLPKYVFSSDGGQKVNNKNARLSHAHETF